MPPQNDDENDPVEPEQPATEAALVDKPFRGELLGFRPSSRVGLSAARVSAAERLRRHLAALQGGEREPGEGGEP